MESDSLSDLYGKVQAIIDEHRCSLSALDVQTLEEVLEIIEELQLPNESLSVIDRQIRFVTVIARILEFLEVLD